MPKNLLTSLNGVDILLYSQPKNLRYLHPWLSLLLKGPEAKIRKMWARLRVSRQLDIIVLLDWITIAFGVDSLFIVFHAFVVLCVTAFNLSWTHSETDCINSLKKEMLNIQRLPYDVNAKSSVSITFTIDFIIDRLNFKIYLSLLQLFLQKFWELTICLYLYWKNHALFITAFGINIT